MTTNRFRTVALALRDHISDTYALLAATDAVVALDPQEPTPGSHEAYVSHHLPIPHGLLVMAALGSETVMREVRAGKRINAIKALRIFGVNDTQNQTINLRAAKEAIEDARVEAFFNADNRWSMPQGDPWDLGTHNDEPPF